MSSAADDFKKEVRDSSPQAVRKMFGCWSAVMSRGFTANLAEKLAREEGKEPDHTRYPPGEWYLSVKQMREPSPKDLVILEELVKALGATGEEFSVVGSRQFRWVDEN
jgi:hypothetical protein